MEYYTHSITSSRKAEVKKEIKIPNVTVQYLGYLILALDQSNRARNLSLYAIRFAVQIEPYWHSSVFHFRAKSAISRDKRPYILVRKELR